MPRDKEKHLLASRLWKKANRERKNATERAWREANPEKVCAYRKKFALVNPDKKKAWNAAYRKANPDKIKYHALLRMARIEFNGGRLPKNHRDILFDKQDGKCGACLTDLKASGFHRDHIIPVCRGGKTVMRNIQLLCPPCNRKKSGKLISL